MNKKNDKNIYTYIAAALVALVVGIMIGKFALNSNLGQNINEEVEKAEIEKVFNESLGGKNKIDIVAVKPEGNIMEIKIKSKGNKDEIESVIYVSDDKNSFYEKVVDIKKIEEAKKKAEEQRKKEATPMIKNDKPVVELFVMSYCPYGTQAEKGYLPAVKTLGDKIDAKVKFVNYVMHPSQGEAEENLLQFCIQENYPTKFNEYLSCFLEEGKSEKCLAKNEIKKESLKKCINGTDEKFGVIKSLKDKASWINGRYPKFNIQDDLNKKYGVQGSPTLIVNGKKIVNAGRNPQAMLDIFCSAFNVKPEECNEKLDTKSPKAGFGTIDDGASASEGGGCGA